jgi:hypothetical protein
MSYISRHPTLARLLGAAITAGGFVGVFFGLGLSKVLPHEGWPWLALAGAVAASCPGPAVVRVVLWTAAAAVTAWRVVPLGLFDDEVWQPYRILCYACPAAIVLTVGLISPLLRRRDLFPWALVAVLGACVVWGAGIASFAFLAVALAASLVVVGLVDWGGRAASGAAGVAAVLHPALLAAGAFNNFGDVPLWKFAAVALAPVLLPILARPPFRD